VSKKPSIQLAFEFAAEEREFVLTRPLSRHRFRNNLVRKLHYVRRFFPELDGQSIRVGLTRAATGLAVPGGDELWINPSQTSYHSLAHEFVQDRKSKKNAAKSRDLISDMAFKKGLMLLPCGKSNIRYIPPLNIPEEQLSTGFDILEDCIKYVNKNRAD